MRKIKMKKEENNPINAVIYLVSGKNIKVKCIKRVIKILLDDENPYLLDDNGNMIMKRNIEYIKFEK